MDDIQITLLLPLLSVIVSITMLQNFAANVGGTDIIDFKKIFSQYKSIIITDCAVRDVERNRKLGRKKASELNNLATNLADKVPLDVLRVELISVLQTDYEGDPEKSDWAYQSAKKFVETLETTETDSTLLKRQFARELVKLNSLHGDRLLNKYRKQKIS